jgi:alkylation response protein AidB-like acyl-CoA dehydrogenase
VAAELARSEVEVELARCERNEEFPEELVTRLRQLDLPLLFAAAPGPEITTTYHIHTLNALAAQRSASLAITLGITGLALLPAYLAATDDQLARIRERVLAGGQVAMLLSEWQRGSNLAGTETRGERGHIDGGAFRPIAPGQPAGHYRITGEKQLINLVRRADLLMTLVRTGEPAPGSLGRAGGLTMLLVERDGTVENLPRWRTLPAPAADIGGARFSGTLVPAERRIGEEGEGFRLVQSALTLSRGGIAAFASGTASRACGLAFAYASERAPYGEPIARLEPIAGHLARMAALDLAVTCVSLRAAAAANALGLRAAHQTAVAKLVACDLAERAVTEGRAVLSARALLHEHPYQQVVRDVILYGIFDGTRHVMLDQIAWRARQMCRPGAGAEAVQVYREPPARLDRSARRRGRPWLPRPSETAAALAELPGDVDVAPLAMACRALEAALAGVDADTWARPSFAFAIAASWADLEAALAVAELGDPTRRAALGMTAMPAADLPQPDLAELAVALIAGEALMSARRILAGAGVDLPLAPERELAIMEHRAGARVRGAVQANN